MPDIPRDPLPDATLALLAKPYDFVSERCRRLESDLFETRLLLRKTVCMMGEEAARLVYDAERFERAGAVPGRFRKTLFGTGGVQGLDGDAHVHRKRMFLSLMSDERIAALSDLTLEHLRERARAWNAQDAVELYAEAREILCAAVCDWAGVPLHSNDLSQRTRWLSSLYEDAGSVGPRHWRGRIARRRSEAWARDVIEAVRAERLSPPEASAAHVIAWHRDPHDRLLPAQVAAVELLNVIRPTVAVSVFFASTAVALQEHPACREKLAIGEPGYEECFAHEVRRYYPFFPFVAARTRKEFEWRGYRFPAGRRVLLDLHATDHDPRYWEDPERFDPDRFRTWDGSAFGFVPQGGGDHERGHRCPGEWIAIALIATFARFLLHDISYRVPEQDLSIDRSRLPALPRSGFVMRDVRVVTATP